MCRFIPKYRLFALCCSLGLLLVLGCSNKSGGGVGEGRTKPRGRILENGLPIKIDTSKLPPGDPGLQVTFIKLGGVDAGTEYEAVVTDSANGAFELIGKDGKGIPPGKYRVVITLAPFGSEDMLKGRFSRERSKIEIEVKPGEDVVIDIAQYK
ncbi:MAG: carboxypeptidase-like regulatory domain-containing protein [Gemmataceae bacterium]|nr:carboxypeptidase-like regulatory domain-containing protein [Gemmataceae bacterium]